MTNEQLKYIDQLQAYAIKNPAWFWSDAEDASKARQWLYDNGASKIVDDIYNRHTPDDIKQKINPKKLSSAVRTKNLQDDIVEGQNAFLDTAGAVALRTAPIILATPAAMAAPGAVLGGIVGGTIGNEVTNKLVNYLSNGKYSDWGSLFRGGKDYGQTVNTFADFTNPGAILLGGLGAYGGWAVNKHWTPSLKFNSNSAYRITDKLGLINAKQTGTINSGPTSNYPHFTKGRPFARIHKGDYLIETRPEVSLGRYDSHMLSKDLFSSNNLEIGESVTPIMRRNIPMNVSTNNVNIYKKLPIGYWRKTVKGIEDFGIPNYGNVRFIRNVGTLPKVENGKVYLSPKDNALTNMTYDQSFITHKNYRSRPGEDYIIIEPSAFKGQKFLSIEPMDTFLENNPIDVNKITILSGNPSKIASAKKSGFNVIEDQNLINLYNKIVSGIKEDNTGGIRLTKEGFGHQEEVPAYDILANNIIKQRFGDVDYYAVKALENATGLKSGVSPDNFGGNYDWNVFWNKYKTATLNDAKNLKYSYPNGRSISIFNVSKEPSPSNILSKKIFYDPAPHIEIDLLGISHPSRAEFNTPSVQNSVSKLNNFPLL